MKRWQAGLGLVLGLLLSGAVPANADDQAVLQQMGKKLSRGIANVATGWAEIPKQIYLVGRDEGWVTGAIRGSFDGLGMCVARTVAGIYEIFTFPVPIPPQYQPMLEPDYVWQAEPAETEATNLKPTSPREPFDP
jgi:putative exosortase-associated protein (TIGR04073 family)